MNKKNIVNIISHIDKSFVFEWTFSRFDRSKNNYYFILIHERVTNFENFLLQCGFEVFRVPYKGKLSTWFALWKTFRILKKLKSDIVHAHLFEGCLIGLTAAYFAGVKKRIHTRHNATYHLKYYPSAVKYDKLINFLSTDIVAISKNVKNILMQYEKVPEKKIRIIYHGLDFDYINGINQEKISEIKSRHGIKGGPVIGIISRYVEWKGLQYSLPAIKKFIDEHENAFLVMANAEGPYKSKVKTLLSAFPPDRYVEIPFEPDIYALMKAMDFIVHVPEDHEAEAFGLVYVESMACKVPSVITLSGIASEVASDKENALVVPHKNSDEIFHALKKLYIDKELSRKLKENAYVKAKQMFDIEKIIPQVEALYE
ncbi:MAG: glycosyltransferase family 4 protein [Bacteroidia bacterium]|nr:glycosyltransferase family 4 protein [Bacteroidia bacterium]